MKYLSLIIMILMSPSCSISKKNASVVKEKLIVTFSKGKCLGNCPVYDLYIYNNGRVVYNGIDNVKKKGVYETLIALDTVKRIEYLMKHFSPEEIGNTNGRDIPFTILKINDKKVVYRSTRSSGNLLKINNLIENIKDKL
ncbi:DUF6438 domain-containing protein [Jejuia spongiicola]|uniref:DUF6438 domain-containing protein n=1 Tax=Jejuia spongiicola TaxID=2942207 RepID=A0ABT0Q952_9FLAO|nr:DUF6438 domain-containing protein [Jejuia spongiicola]MCL6293443.1 DUF6438 domain-containing protein [Jejuia spongiicola]